DGKFPIKPSEHKPDFPKGIDEWLQTFCEFDPEDRFASAAIAKKQFEDLILPEGKSEKKPSALASDIPDDLTNLPVDFVLAERFSVQRKL
ncbi:hypothetical protein, partial [Klebsiella pneumoniae]